MSTRVVRLQISRLAELAVALRDPATTWSQILDSPHAAVVVFTCREQAEAFGGRFGKRFAGKYTDGRELAPLLGCALPGCQDPTASIPEAKQGRVKKEKKRRDLEGSEALVTFVEKRERELDLKDRLLDTEYWTALCFDTAEQLAIFLAWCGEAYRPPYVDGIALANRIGLELPPSLDFPPERPFSARMTALASERPPSD